MSVPSSAAESVAALTPAPLVLADVSASLRFGLSQFRTLPLLSSGLSALFVAIGLLMFAALEYGQIAPMSLSLAGGFMLVGPILLAGFFSVSDKIRKGRHAHFGDIWDGFRRMPRGGWVVSFVCGLLFLIWVTDAGILYGFMVGREAFGFLRLLKVEGLVVNYAAYSAIMGAILAFILFTVSAFSIRKSTPTLRWSISHSNWTVDPWTTVRCLGHRALMALRVSAVPAKTEKDPPEFVSEW